MVTQSDEDIGRRNTRIIASIIVILIIINLGRNLLIPTEVEVFEGKPIFGETRSFEVPAKADQLQVLISWDGCDAKYRTQVELNVVLVGISLATETDLKRIDKNLGSTSLWKEGTISYEINHKSKYDSYYFRENSPFIRNMKIKVVARIPPFIS